MYQQLVISVSYSLYFLLVLSPFWVEICGFFAWSTYILNITFLAAVVVQLLSHVQLFAILWTTECQSPLSFTISWSSFKLMSIETVMLSNHLILCRPLLLLPSIFPCIRVFSHELALLISGLSIGVSASASVLLMNIRGWFPLGLAGLISLQSKGLSSAFSNTTIWKNQFFSTQPFLWSNSHIIHDYWKNHSFDCIDLCQQSDVSSF